jgi:hypothetical protein
VPPADRLRRKLTVRAHGRTLVLVKRAEESGEHVVQKALLWVRYLPRYPDLRVEQHLPFPSRYKPDLYALDATGQGVTFWGECGVVSEEKLRAVLRAHPACHFAFSKWAARTDLFAALIDRALAGVRRTAPVELLGLPPTADAWLDEDAPAVPDESIERRVWDAAARPGARGPGPDVKR